MKYIDYESINSNFQKEFFKSDFQAIFGMFYNDFLINFLSKIETINDFNSFINFFNLNNKQENRKFVEISVFYTIFKSKQIEFYHNNFDNFIIILLFLISLFYKNNGKSKINEILIDLENNFNDKEIIKILIANILNNYSNDENYLFLKPIILNYYYQKFKNNNNNINYLIKILNLIKENEDLNIMFDEILKFQINVDDFYLDSQNETIDLIFQITKTKYYKLPYTENIRKIKFLKNLFKDLYHQLNNDNFTIEEAKKINSLNDDKLKKRFVILFDGNEIKANNKFNNFKNKIEQISNYKIKLNKILFFLKTFFKTKYLNYINEYSEKLERFETIKINNSLFFSEDQHFQTFFELSQKINLFSNSKFFFGLFEIQKEIRNINDFQKLENAYENFQKLKKFLLKGKISNEILKGITLNIVNINDIENELIFLKSYFKINNINEEVRFILENYLKKKILQKPINNLIQLITDFNAKNTEVYSTLMKQKNRFENSKGNFSKEMIEEIKRDIDNLHLEIFNSKKSLEILDKIYYKIDNHIKFLIESKTELIDQLYEHIADTNVRPEDLNAFKTCCQFVQKISIYKDINDRELLDYFIKTVENSNLKLILISFEIIGNKYEDVKDLYKIHFDSSAKKREDIIAFYTQSKITLIFQIPKYNCKVNYGRVKDINFEDILDLRDDALLRIANENDEDFKSKIESFAKNIQIISDIIKYLELISLKGSIEDSNYIITITRGVGKARKEGDNDTKTIEDLLQQLKDFYMKQNTILKNIYNQFPFLRLISGRIFNKLNNAIKNRKHDNLIFINKYLTNNNYLNKPDFSEIRTNERDKLKQMYDKINQYISILYRINNVNLKKVFENAKKKDNLNLPNFNFAGIKSTKFSKDLIEQKAIELFILLTGNNPISQVILNCNSETNEEEIISFLYRSILFSEYPCLFLIIKPENLDKEIQSKMLDTIKELLDNLKTNNNRLISCLYFLYYDNNSDIISEIKSLSEYEDYIPDLSNINYSINSIEVYSSIQPGLGKSTKIYNEFMNDNNLIYKYFPLGGDINRKDLILRLLELEQGKNYGFHLDLYESKKTDLIREFLFSFLITKFYSKNDDIFYYGNELKIKIEIPVTIFEDFLIKYPMIKIFKQIPKIKSIPRPKLILNNRLDSNFQITFNYLKYYDQGLINENNIKINNEVNQGLNIQILDVDTCENLLKKYLTIQKPNFYQISAFIKILGNQFSLFSINYFLDANSQENSNIKKFRSFFIKCLINVTKHFITSAYSNILEEQQIANRRQNQNYNEELALEEAKAKLQVKNLVSYDNINPSLIVFNSDGQSLTFICTENETEEEKRTINNFLNSQSLGKEKEAPNYKKYKSEEFYDALIKLLDLHRKIIPKTLNMDRNELKKQYSNYYTNYQDKNWQSMDEIVDSYIFTSDNFIKLILIITRIRANLPVILMGETGCGKTSLIRILYDLQFKTTEQNSSNMLIYNIHAGINDNDIITFLNENELYDFDFEKKNIGNEKEKWVFFDEINTCNSMGLLSEILCKHTCLGRKLKENVKFIAACNPYRIVTKKFETVGLYDEKKHIQRNLVYTVNPLPTSLLNYIFDFGNLRKEDEKKYINNILTDEFSKLIFDQNIRKQMIIIAENCICEAQNFIRENYEVSAISLREIRRFIILFQFFQDLLKKKKYNPLKENPIFKSMDENQLNKLSINLGVYLCYYIRLFQKNLREQFCKIMKKENCFGNNFDFEKIPKILQLEIAENVVLEEGIATNQALLENLFCLFVCICNKIPLFIVGKPGCSKSLSVQSILRSMNGEDSTKEIFKTQPKLRVYNYQGSLTSTSEGIKKVFDNARKGMERNVNNSNNQNNSLNNKLKKIINENVIPVIFFDEMGLAEISDNNPLKVIHSELEYDEQRTKVAFVGISNWSLDASKMNRGIYLSIPEPGEDDLIKTALSIAESYHNKLEINFKDCYVSLAKGYFNYIKYRKNERNKEFMNFHGSRDFYHLIKNVSRNFIKYEFENPNLKINNNVKSNILMRGIERNFGGLQDSISKFKEFVGKYYKFENINNEYNVMNCIGSNIIDYESRYLLIISKSSLSQILIESILKKKRKNFYFLFGGNFRKNIIQEYYTARILNKVQAYIDTDSVLVMKNLESIYPSLYELFNQSFRREGQRKKTRISLGRSTNPDPYVHDNFRAIILVDPKEIDLQDPPFLNRFEKHIMSYEFLLNQNLKSIAKNMNKLINEFIIIKNKEKIRIDLYSQLINCDEEEIFAFLFHLNENKNDEQLNSNNNNLEDNMDDDFENSEQIYFFKDQNQQQLSFKMQYVKNKNDNNDYFGQFLQKIVPTFSQDLMTFISISDYKEKNKDIYNTIKNIYQETYYPNIKSYLEKINTNIHIIYTFSNILSSLFENNNTQKFFNRKFGEFNHQKTEKITIENCNSDEEIEDLLIQFLKTNKNLIYFQFTNDDCVHLSYIKYKLDRFLSEQDYSNKVFLFIIYLERLFPVPDYLGIKKKKINNQYLIPHLLGLNQIFIDNLNGCEIKIFDLLQQSKENLFKNIHLIDKEKEFKEGLYTAFMLIRHQFIDSQDTEENYVEKCINFILNNNDFNSKLKNTILKKLNEDETNIFESLYYKNVFRKNCVDLISVISLYLKELYRETLVKLIIKMEREGFLNTIIKNNDKLNTTIYQTIIDSYFDISNLKDFKYSNELKQNYVEIIDCLVIPGSLEVFSKTRNYVETIKGDYFDNENNMLNNEEEYKSKKEIFKNNTIIELEKSDLMNVLNNNINLLNNDEFFKDFIFDYFKILLIKKETKDFVNYFNDFIFQFLNILFGLIYYNWEEKKQQIATIILWFESYCEYIFPLFPLINIMNSFDPGIYNIMIDSKINAMIDQQNLRIKSNKDNQKGKIRRILYLLYESILNYLFENSSIFYDISEENFRNFLMILENVSFCIMQANINMELGLKQIYNLNSFNKVKKVLEENGNNTIDNLIEYLTFLESNVIINMEKTIEMLTKEINFINNNIFDEDKKYELLIEIFSNKLLINENEENNEEIEKEEEKKNNIDLRVSNNNFLDENNNIFNINLNNNDENNIDIEENKNSLKVFLLKKVLENSKFISKSKNFLQLLLSNSNLVPENIKENKLNNTIKIRIINEYPKIKKVNYKILEILNQCKNIFLEEILIQLFETSIYSFFSQKKILKEKISGIAFDYFFKSFNFIEENYKNFNVNKIECLYHICYIKCFCSEITTLIINNYSNLQNEIDNFNTLISSKENPINKVIKLYILKSLNLLHFNNFEEFRSFNFYDNGIRWIEEFNIYDNESANILSFLFFNINQIEYYKKLKKEKNKTNFQNQNNDLISLINNSGFDNFYNFIINEYISKLQDNDFKETLFKQFTQNLTQLLPYFIALTENSIRILSIYLNYDIFTRKYNNLIQNLSSIEELEILLYSHKFTLMCSLLNQNSFYSKLTSLDIENTINTNFIPGGEPNDSILIQFSKDLEQHLISTNHTSPGAYVCSCGYFYTVDECSLPTRISPCPICGLPIGGENHKLVERNGHFRVFYNQAQVDNITHRSYYKKMNYMLLSQYKNLVEEEKRKEVIGVKFVNKDFFLKRDKEVRGLSNISYRILNFIFYSCIFYSEINDKNKFCCFVERNNNNRKIKEKINIMEMLKINWNILKDELATKGINFIQIYFNMIYPDIKNIFMNSTMMNTKENRASFEREINNYIENSFNTFQNYYQNYINSNNELLEIKNISTKSYLDETVDINLVSDDEYPFYKYFILSKYPSLNDLNRYIEINSLKNKYPIISSYLQYYDSEGIKDLKNLCKLNNFEMYMLNRHSYNLTRNESKKITIKQDLLKINNENVNKMYEEFENGYNNLSHYIFRTDFVCHVNLPEMQKEKKIKKDDCLAFCLNDKGEINYGIYLAVYYHELIKIQNGFLNLIKANLNQKEIIYFKEAISKEIYIQKATSFDIIDLDIKKTLFKNIDELIFSYTYRDCFNFNTNKINYVKYREIKYNLDKIEIELGKILLPGKKIFKTEQIFITYGFEGYNGNNSTILSDFKKKYEQISLNLNEENALLKSLNGKEYKNILFSIEMLFYYLVNGGGNTNKENTIRDFIRNLPKFIIVKDDMRILFEELNNFKIKHLIHIYEFIEKVNCNNIFETIEELYKMKIDGKTKNNILKYNDENKLITKIILADVVRKFISRFLSGNRTEREINDNTPILDWIIEKDEIWPEKVLKEQAIFDREIDILKKIMPIKVNLSIDFYYTLLMKK